MIAGALVTVDPRSRHREMRSTGDLRVYEPHGGPRALFFCFDPEVLIEGPAGTGKSLACLKRLDRNAVKYPGSRQLILRKTRESLTQSALVTFENHVIIPGGRVRFHTTQQAYLYPNGSKIVVGGLDKDSKVMSSEYDTIYVQEATELEESEAEALTTRLRHGVIPHQQLLMDCNPGPPNHWLNRRCGAGKTTRILSHHEDNPALFNPRTGVITEGGRAYIARLDKLSGARYERLRLGKWVGAEGVVYPSFDRRVHVQTVDCEGWRTVNGLDLGTRNPTVILTVRHSGDRLHIEREIYQRGMGSGDIEDAAVKEYERSKAEFLVVDPSAAGLIVSLGQRGLTVRKAVNDVILGISRVTDVLSDITVDPLCVNTIAEFESYQYPERQRQERDVPVKANDHAMDTLRYVVMEIVDPTPTWDDLDTGDLFARLRAAGIG